MFPNSKDTTDLATPVAGESQYETVTRIVEDMLKHRSAEEIARDPIFVQLYASSALATMDYSSWEKALQVLEKAVTESLASTDSFVLTHLLAEARLRTGRTAGALAAAERALELFPNEGTTVRQYVIAAVAEGRREDAERVLGAAIEAGPQDSPDALRTLKDLKRRLKAGVYENPSTAELVTRLADSVSMPNDEDVLFGGVTTLYDIALRRELLRAIVSDPKKHAKNLRILKATEPVLTEEGVFACRSSLQEEGFPIEFNLPYAGISMIAPEALRSFARGVLMGDFGRVEKLRVDDPFEAKVFSEGGKTETVSLLSYFGSSCAESRLTGDEVVYRPMTIEDERILASKEFRPADSDREAWLALIADWVAAGAYAPLARIDDLGESQYNDFAVELARANLVAESDTGLRVLKRKKAIGLLEQALDEADEEALDDEERFRILQVLGMAYYTDERHWDAVQTFKRALKIRIDSTVLVSLGYALAANSTGILDEPFDVRTARTWMLLTKSARTLRRHIRSAYASGRNARDAVVPAMTGLCGDWVHRAGFESKSERMGYVILSGNCDMAQIFAELAFVEHKPAIAANDWKFEVGMREDLRIDERLQEWIEPLGLKSIRIDPKPAGDMIALTVYLESDDPRPRCYHEAVARQVVAEAIGEAPFMYFCMQEIRFRHEPALDRGMTPSAFAHYFYDMFPQAWAATCATLSFDWHFVTNYEIDTRPEAPLFADIKSGDTFFRGLFDPKIFVDPQAPGLRFSRLMQSYGAQPVTIAFEIARSEGTNEFVLDPTTVVVNFRLHLEGTGAARMVGMAYGENRTYMNLVLWRPDQALLEASRWFSAEKGVKWAVYRSLFPLTFIQTLALNDPSAARAALAPLGAFAMLDEAELADPTSVVKKFEVAFEEGQERRARISYENACRGDIFKALDGAYGPEVPEPQFGCFQTRKRRKGFFVDINGKVRQYRDVPKKQWR